MHRRDHNQWQFPGGEIAEDELTEAAAARHLEGKIGLQTSSANIRILGHIAATLGDVQYEADIVTPYQWIDKPFLKEWGQYDDYGYFNVLGYGMGRHSMSPIVEKFGRQVSNGIISPWWENPVQ